MKNRVFTKLFSCLFAIVSVFSIVVTMASATGNVSDQIKTYTYNGDGGAIATPLREKRDATSSYIKNYSTSKQLYQRVLVEQKRQATAICLTGTINLPIMLLIWVN